MKKQKQFDATSILVWVIMALLIIYTITIFFILAWGLMTSLKSNNDFLVYRNKVGLPSWSRSRAEILLGNYWKIITNFNMRISVSYYSGNTLINKTSTIYFPEMILNTVIYAGGSALMATIVPCLMGYFCAKYKYVFSKILYTTVVVVMMVPVIGQYPSMLTFLRNVSLYDTFFSALIMAGNFTGMYYLVFYAFYEGMTDSYSEAAEIDGATQFDILMRIMLPLASKMLSTVALILFISYWNDYQVTNLYLPTHPTLACSVYSMVYSTGASKGFSAVPIRVAGCMLLVTPVLILFIALKDKLMGNVSLGGVKE